MIPFVAVDWDEDWLQFLDVTEIHRTDVAVVHVEPVHSTAAKKSSSNPTPNEEEDAEDPIARYVQHKAQQLDMKEKTFAKTKMHTRPATAQDIARLLVTGSAPGKYVWQCAITQGIHLQELPALPPTSRITLDQCLKFYTHREHLEGDNAWYCSRCKKHQPAEKSVSLWRLPPVLMITLKRFDYHQMDVMSRSMGYNEKIDTFVDFPINSLNMAPYTTKHRRSRSRTLSNMSARQFMGHSAMGTPTKPMEVEGEEESPQPTIASTTYDLFAVCNHYGRSGFGHYTALARDWKDTQSLGEELREVYELLEEEPDAAFCPWYLYDDEAVHMVGTPPTSTAEQDPLGLGKATPVIKNVEGNIKTNQAYILFYRLRYET